MGKEWVLLNQKGQGLAEYALILVSIIIVVVVALRGIAPQLVQIFNDATAQF